MFLGVDEVVYVDMEELAEDDWWLWAELVVLRERRSEVVVVSSSLTLMKMICWALVRG